MARQPPGAEKLFSVTRHFLGKNGQRQLEKAYDFALESHKDQLRKSGEHFIEHPVAVATVLAGLELDADTLSAALLHDVVEDTPLTLADIRVEFGEEITDIIDGVTNLERFKFSSREEEQAENMRKMLIAVTRDVRVILIKLADRLHNMETISALPSDRRREIATETLEIYAPLAHRFGISQIKWRLEDLALETLHPKRYQQIQKMVAERRGEREKFMKQVEDHISDQLKKNKVKAQVSGRVKHFYSIYEKMVNRGVEFDEIMDLSAVRVTVDSVRDCYGALGVIHSMWKPVPGRFKDYIAMPKLNMYRSLHTVVIGIEGRPIEIQIRTEEMHRTAEYGIAAHWLYKETKRRDQGGRGWLKQVMEWQQELTDPSEFMKTLKVDLFQDEVFVFTPKGKLISLPRGSTPLDFAYNIHPEVGHSCVGAKVNGKMVPLSYQLQTGDMVDIMTSKIARGPSQDWLGIVETPRARNKIRQWFSRERREDEQQEGKEALERAMRKRSLPLHSKDVGRVLAQVAEDYHCARVEELYRLVGAGNFSAGQIASKVANYLGLGKKDLIVPEKEAEKPRPEIEAEEARHGQRISVQGIENALVQVAHCCYPSPGDPIVGFVTRGRGVSVHRADCTNVQGLSREADRMIDVSWEEAPQALRVAEVCVKAMDRPKLVRDITTVLGDHHINIISASFSIDAQHIARSNYIFEIASNVHLEEIIKGVKKIDSVYDVIEVKSDEETGTD
ncbi:MAG: bifunctional (p)ppGpp synthetase/guanosine-3',5'-bis(diphosphate) 3'-pyrophosphohydrolase [Actinobacteria bacterium]|nr:bifunctional (p)ppGpp synthetase/guanosine-3',5'-bis(diphosphate) 3'-pyrophosphohydrolase [Actinomycetota bacterium]